MLSSLQSLVGHLSDMQVNSCRPAPSSLEFVMFIPLKGEACVDSIWDYAYAYSGLRTKLSKMMARKGTQGS